MSQQQHDQPQSTTESESPSHSSRLVIVDYKDIAADPADVDLSPLLERAFGGNSSSSSSTTNTSSAASPLGIIAIRNIPDYTAAKASFLPHAHSLARLPPSYLEGTLSDPSSFYNAGWSHGKETLGRNRRPDLAKASYYFNPITDEPGTEHERKEYPASYPSNRWPDEQTFPEMANFKQSARNLGTLMREVVVHLAKHVDALAEKHVEGYSKGLLHRSMAGTEKVKGRLLYYFPLDETKESMQNEMGEAVDSTIPYENDTKHGDTEKQPDDSDESFDNWIGWHNDSGFLTALAGDLYVDHATGDVLPPSRIDPRAGLYVADRSGESIKVTIPEDCMAVQIGECLQILTGGVVVATPHCVRGPRPGWNEGGMNAAGISFPCFVDAKPTFPLTMPGGCRRGDVLGSGVGRDKVPPLEERWMENGMTFGEFLQTSFEKYYEWK